MRSIAEALMLSDRLKSGGEPKAKKKSSTFRLRADTIAKLKDMAKTSGQDMTFVFEEIVGWAFEELKAERKQLGGKRSNS